MPTYVALVDGKTGAYGAMFPDAPGCHAMGKTIEQALLSARSALSEWIAHSRANGMNVPEPCLAEELLKDPEVVEEMKVTGAVMREVDI